MYLKLLKGKMTIHSKVNMFFNDCDVIKCIGCKKEKTIEDFKYGCLNCDKCIAYKRAWNKKRSEENRLINPSTFCEICQRFSRDDRWEEHLNLKTHKLKVLLLEFEEEMASAKEEEKEQLQKEHDIRLKELTDYYEDMRQKQLNNKSQKSNNKLLYELCC